MLKSLQKNEKYNNETAPLDEREVVRDQRRIGDVDYSMEETTRNQYRKPQQLAHTSQMDTPDVGQIELTHACSRPHQHYRPRPTSR